jgi:4-alpha-glucanotransferase
VAQLDLVLRELAQEYGIATEFWDWHGRHVPVRADTIVAVLRALDVDAHDVEAAQRALEARRREPWTRMLPTCIVTRQGQPDQQSPSFWVHVTHGRPVQVWIDLETGGERHGLQQLEDWTPPQEVDGRLVGQATFRLSGDLPLGYHTLRARSDGQEASTPLIVTPSWVGLPARLGDRRAWGFATQLYSVRSKRSWGVGDLTDLTDLAVWSAAEHDAGFVLVNPLHAAEPVAPMEPSPYLPTSRRFGNPIYLRVERIPEYADADATTRAEIDVIRTQLLKELDGVDRIDRDAAWADRKSVV